MRIHVLMFVLLLGRLSMYKSALPRDCEGASYVVRHGGSGWLRPCTVEFLTRPALDSPTLNHSEVGNG